MTRILRIVNKESLDLVVKKLKPTGMIYISTDVQELWQDMNDIIMEQGRFEQIQDPAFWEQFGRSRWDEISEEKKRDVYCGVFGKKGA